MLRCITPQLASHGGERKRNTVRGGNEKRDRRVEGKTGGRASRVEESKLGRRTRGSREQRGGEVLQGRQLPCHGARRVTLEKGGLEYFWDRG